MSEHPTTEAVPTWRGRRGEREPNPYAAMTVAERIELVWPLTLSA